jgi:CheY-like chemotaxis protein
MADDHFPDVVLVKEALRSNGVTFEMDVFQEGEAALRWVIASAEGRQSKPDLIVLDVNMSGMSGLAVLREVRALPIFDGTPVAMLTSSLSPALRAEALLLKANACLVKPAHLEEFLSGVGKVLSHLLNSRFNNSTTREPTL